MAEIQLTDIDKKLEILISTFNLEVSLNKEFRASVNSDYKDLEKRVRESENWINTTKRDHSDFAQARNSIIKWVVGSTLGMSAVGVTIITILIKGGISAS